MPRPVRTPQAHMNAHVPLASAYPTMARTVKVRLLMYACVGVCVCVHVSVVMHGVLCFLSILRMTYGFVYVFVVFSVHEKKNTS